MMPANQRLGLLAWFAGNPVAANLLMLLIITGGVLGVLGVDKEVFPRFSPNKIHIEAVFPGAGPTEVEESVCVPIEEAIHDVPGVKHLHGEIRGDNCQIGVEILPDYDRNQLMATLQSRVQAIPRLPKQLEKIQVLPADREDDDGVIWLALHGATDAATLQRYGDRIQEQLAAIPGVSRARNYGELVYEIDIEVSPQQLRKYQLTLDELAQAVRKASVDLPGGLIKNPDGELLLRVSGRARDADAVGALIVKTLPDGNRVRLEQIATIKDGLEERLWAWHHNGQTAQGWEIHAEQDSVAVARRVKAYVEEMRAQLPEGLRLITWWDDSQAYDERIGTLLEDGLSGFVLVCLVLTLFLRLRVALWAGVGIFTSVLGAFWLMPALDISLNMLSLFGFLLAMGILVDDAIIIGESVHSRQIKGQQSPLQATISGVREVALPVSLSVLIVLVAFLPGLFLPGWAGQMMRPICLVMILTLVFSLVEALLILPSHLVGDIDTEVKPGYIQRLRERMNRGLDRFVARIYRPLLKTALAWRYLTVALFIALLAICVALVLSDRVRQSINPDVTKDSFWVSMQLPQSAPYSETQALATQVEKALFALRDELDGMDQARINSVQAAHANNQSVIIGVETIIWEHGAGIWLEFSAEGRRRLRVEEFIRDWRQRIGDIGRGKIDFIYKEGDVPYDIELMLSAGNPNVLPPAAEQLKALLNEFAGVYDVIDSSEPGKSEVRLALKPEAERLGLRLEQLAEQVRQGYYGEEVHRFLRGRREVKVMVRYPLEQRQSLDALKAQPVRLPNGSSVPLNDLAEIKLVQGYSRLNREDRQRVLKVQARVDPTQADVNGIYAALEGGALPRLEQAFPGLNVQIGQRRQEQEAMLAAFGKNTLIALLVIYALIAVPFKSYSKPLIFLLAAPVAWSGAVLAHWAAGLPLSMESLVGMIAASGVVVNDSLVLLDYIRQHGDDDTPVETLISAACTSRFRPILLAFLTNFAGFLPTLLETSPQAQFLIPMTLSLSAGLLIGMAASLILTPVCYAILGSSR
ncbi:MULTISPECIES: efflux RND transporter permease subunit [Methylomonas]|uniref:Acriflavin resistance protein n=2 Tax=Methylomonas TaxID=416 RepID=A0A126T3R4_9GAMM|nr:MULTISPECIES: efflux RND transporter permease subunit [Methylomonas]AMK76729.1 acriflavin resistance protein [Methylomonas denitrificans]OAI00029.1 acriflavin resistance protein [Methylomonas methanica]TCV82778.1 multidrug efflux pump subunit AcrB [Methylomonas methanica]